MGYIYNNFYWWATHMHKSKSYQKGKDDDKKGCNISVVPGCRKIPPGRKIVAVVERWPFAEARLYLVGTWERVHKYEIALSGIVLTEFALVKAL